MATGTIISKTDVYSTAEVETDKVWVDGKKIYRKTVVVNSSIAAGDFTVASGIEVGVISQMVLEYGIGLNNANYFPIPYPFSSSTLGYFYFKTTTSEIVGHMPFNSSRTIFVFEYTKS